MPRERARARCRGAMSSQPSGAHALTAVPTSLERRWHLSFERLRPLLQQPCEAAASASLHSLVHESRDGEREVAQALLYGLLTQPHVAALLFRLICCLRDVELAVSELVQLVLWRYAPLQQSAKQQLLWLLSQLVRSRVAGAHRLALALLRQVGAADCSPPNLWLADNLGSFFAHHAEWLLLEEGRDTDEMSAGREAALLVPSVLLAFLRLAAEHGGALLALQGRELKLCAMLWSRRPSITPLAGPLFTLSRPSTNPQQARHAPCTHTSCHAMDTSVHTPCDRYLERRVCAYSSLGRRRQRACLYLGRELFRLLRPLRETALAGPMWCELQQLQADAEAGAQPGPLCTPASEELLRARVTPEACIHAHAHAHACMRASHICTCSCTLHMHMHMHRGHV